MTGDDRGALRIFGPVLGLALGVALGYVVFEVGWVPLRTQREAAGGPGVQRDADDDDNETAMADIETQVADLQQRLNTAVARAQTAEAERDRLKAQATPAPMVTQDSVITERTKFTPADAGTSTGTSSGSGSDAGDAAKARTAWRFGLRTGTPVFDRADWSQLSSAMHDMQGLMPEVLEAVSRGQRDLPAGLRHRIQTLNMKLATFAVGVSEEIEGTGPNGSFTHPAVLANLVRATLASAGAPLSAAQELAIAALGKSWAEEQAQGRATSSSKTPALAQTYREVEAKLRFLLSLKAVLEPTQLEILFQPQTEGRLGLDLTSPALVYILRDYALAADRQALERSAVEKLFEAAGLPAEAAIAHHWAGKAWLDADPQALERRYDEQSTDALFPHVAVLQRAALAQSEAIGHILAAGRLPDDQAQRLRELTTLITPMLQAPPPPPATDESK